MGAFSLEKDCYIVFFHLSISLCWLCRWSSNFNHDPRLDQWQQKLLSTRTAGSWPCHGVPRFSLVCCCWMCWCWSQQLIFIQAASSVPRRSTRIYGSCVLAGDCHGQLWLLDRRPTWRVFWNIWSTGFALLSTILKQFLHLPQVSSLSQASTTTPVVIRSLGLVEIPSVLLSDSYHSTLHGFA